MPNYPELFVLRHGQTEWNAARRMQGSLDSPLTQLGKHQARQQRRILADTHVSAETFDFYCSPQGRAVATADIVLAHLTPRVRRDTRLREISVGAFEGLTQEEIARRWPGVFCADAPLAWYENTPQGEPITAVETRVADFLAELKRPTVVIAHGIVSRVMRAQVLGLDWLAAQDLPGGQGVVYHLKDGTHTQLTA